MRRTIGLKSKISHLMFGSVVVLFYFCFGFFPKNNISAKENIIHNRNTDYRVLKLSHFLSSRKSPLASYAQYLIDTADENNLDWRLIPAITGVESSFGINIPHNSFNAYGWNNGSTRFYDWGSSIRIVANHLSNYYILRGFDTVEKIAPVYNPVTPNEWGQKIRYFMKAIDLSPPHTNEILALNIEI